ncbi:hypothetical protein GOBAR_AA21790 [Gossypium barbadense]|uniref:K-box domain-containing protein n=1 Tax=Gossypium barbadense TaxID=3634 RepID=A0A2P5X6A5_GOSBA|nr:hypothetical protein GOBAR_AA21790 [Gossypium barbadense]
MLTKFISVSEARSLPSNTEINPREQLPAIPVHNDEGLVEDEPKPRQDNVVDKCEVDVDKVLLDNADPHIITSNSNVDGATPFTVLNIFLHGTVEVTHTEFRTFKTWEHAKLKARMETLQRNLRYPQWLQISDTFKACIFLHYEGEDIQNLSLRELQNLEQQLDSALKRIRSKKV